MSNSHIISNLDIMSDSDIASALNAEILPMSAYLEDYKERVSENLQYYGWGGLHATHIGDQFHHGRYTVAAKLSHEPQWLSWLVRDTVAGKWRRLDMYSGVHSELPGRIQDAKYALSHREAEESDAVADEEGYALEWFLHHGPSGTHVCVVYPLNGEGNYFRWTVWDENRINEKWILRQCVKLRRERGEEEEAGAGSAPQSVHDIPEDEMVRILGGRKLIMVTPELRERAHVEPDVRDELLPRYLVASPPRIHDDLDYWLSPEAFQR
ncbi:be73b664-f97c-4a34-873a-cbf627d169cd [Thermothielavioides terrestris]|jgi:hypothetical protein|uniref:Uncharacterized protein n=2 Tax=Thermothielavioides terrestris TaxID=2587410 RepID=G2R674_THETT|nr:uncharacterized protein THITE_2117910 [Thermothielavioides terrestris NRRL 8126]AEO68407.1 hypothetical protein THITE_2117910 [Thermothielavioides terrestris NRRL 8126]SPQ24323.1 be73b664-f97c-4a34-873a-cbf627d169cd [Thermothielavioides terrestris]